MTDFAAAPERHLQNAGDLADSEDVSNVAVAAQQSEPLAVWLALGSTAILLFIVTVVRLHLRGTTMAPSRRAYLRYSVVGYVGWSVVCFGHAALSH